MGASDGRKSCVKCQKAIKSTEKFLVCGLWCRKYFHNDCVGLSNSETRVLSCSKERIKFHCETCENRLGIEVVGEKETREPTKLQNCMNLLELVQKILKLSNDLTNDNSVINKELDTVISSIKRLEEYILQSPKCIEKRTEETRSTGNRVKCVESFSDRGTIEISEENDTTSDNPTVNSVSMGQQADEDSSSLHIASDVPNQLFDNQEAPVAEECNSDVCAPPENLVVQNLFRIEKTEYEGDEENAEIKIEEEECPSSEDFLECDTLTIEKMEHDVDEATVREDIVEDLKQEIESASSDIEPESSIFVSREDKWNSDHINSLLTEVSHLSGKSNKFKRTTKQKISYGNKCGTRCSEHRCEICEKIFVSLQELKEHKSTSRCEPRHCCNVCHRTVSSRFALKEHLLIHTGERPYSCNDCSQTFRRKRSLRRHILLHTGDRPFICTVCSQTFRDMSSLRRHTLVHTGKRPYICNVCSRTFRDMSSLRRHTLVHTGKRPYICNVCSQTFKMKSTLKEHLSLHSVERSYSCNVCSKTFTQKSVLYGHLRLHSH